MSAANVNTTIISKVITEGDPALHYFIKEGVKSEYFGKDERSKRAFDWIVQQWQEHGEVPSEERFNRQFPTFELFPVPDSLSAVVHDLRVAHAFDVAAEITPKISDAFEVDRREFDMEGLLANIGDLQQRVNVITSANDVILGSILANTYLDELFQMDPDAMTGLPTGLKSLDDASGGWQPEQFVVIGAAPKRFKSTFLQWSAMCSAALGKRVGLITHEMSNKEMMEREYSLGAQVPLTAIQRRMFNERDKATGNLTRTARNWRLLMEAYAEKLMASPGEIVYIHDVNAATSLSGLSAIVQSQEQPLDGLFIDGLYQMSDDSRKHSNETAELTAVSRGLKKLAARLEIPVIGTTQALLSRVSKTQGTHMDSIGYTRAFAQDANVLLGIDRPDMTTNDVIVKVMAARSMVGCNLGVYVDFDNGKIQETGEVDLSGDGDNRKHYDD